MSDIKVYFTPGQLGTAFQVEGTTGVVWARAVGLDRLTAAGCGALAKSLGGYVNGLSSPSFASGGVNSPVLTVSPQGALTYCNAGDEATVAGLMQTVLATAANRSNGSTATTVVGPMQPSSLGVPSQFVGV